MTPEEREAPLTAYALNDPGLSAAERQQIETRLAGDPAARTAVDETRRLARILTEGLVAEQSATRTERVVTIPSAKPTRSPGRAWARYVVAATVVLVTAAGSFVAWSKWKSDREAASMAVADRERPRANGPLEVAEYDQESRKSVREEGEGISQRDQPVDALKPLGDMPNKGDGKREDTVKRESAKSPDGAVRTITPVTGSSAPEGGRAVPGERGSGGYGGARGPVPGISGPKTMAGASAIPGGAPAPGLVLPGTPAPPGMPAAPPHPVLPGRPGVPGSGEYFEPTPIPADPRGDVDRAPTNDRHLALIENSFTRVEGINALSTFGVDVDTASYAIVRKYLSMGQLPPPNAVRLEEMVNYFPYRDKAPEGDDPFAVTVEMAECPWEPAHRLVRLGLKAKPIDTEKRPASNIVFLIDVSGSMNEPNKLPLVKASLKLLVNQLGENDRVAMVVYAGASGLVLDSTSATKKETILNALDQLQSGGSTNGAGGIQQAYEVATANFIKGGTNRVVLCTDGDWNVGTTSTDALVKLIEQKRETGVFLSVFGFGMGNLRDEMMVQLAGKGNGNYGYIDTLREANKALVEQIGGTLVTVAKDVKIQVEFNPAAVKSYRLLGYEKRALAAKDFHDDKKDAGEMGAGHVVTALYELVPVGAPDPVVGKIGDLRYQADPAPKPAVKNDKVNEAFVVKMRHKKPDADTSTLRELPVSNISKEYEKASEDFQFAASVASFAMLLRDSQYKGQSNYGLVLELAEAAKKHDPSGYRAEFIEMVKKAKTLSGK